MYKQAIQNKSGIEIGGPSKIFHKEIPVYRFIKKLDGVNFSNNTIWQGSISEGENYNFYKIIIILATGSARLLKAWCLHTFADPRSNTCYRHLLFLDRSPDCRGIGSGISSSCACVWISFNLLYTTTRSCPD